MGSSRQPIAIRCGCGGDGDNSQRRCALADDLDNVAKTIGQVILDESGQVLHRFGIDVTDQCVSSLCRGHCDLVSELDIARQATAVAAKAPLHLRHPARRLYGLWVYTCNGSLRTAEC